MATPVLGYWNYRGLGEPIRYMLHYLGVKFEDKRYEFGPAPNYNNCPWLTTEKTNLGLDFPNLPYYIEGDLKLTQSGVIMSYLARKYGGFYLPSGNQMECLKFGMASGHVTDIVVDFHIRAYSPTYEQDKDAIFQRSRSQLKAASDYLGSKTWFMGEKISTADFMLFEGLDILQIAFPMILKDFENLINYHNRFASIPAIKQYRDKSAKWPILAPRAAFGGKGEMPKH